MKTGVKICGVKTKEALDAAIQNKAQFIGFVFVDESPRYIDPYMVAQLARHIPSTIKTVGLFVNPTDQELDHALSTTSIQFIQLHGSETPRRVQEIKQRFNRPIIKSFPVSTKADLEAYEPFLGLIDLVIFDAKPPKSDGKMTGGSGMSFDWRVLENAQIKLPWMLAGGLNPKNLSKALAITGAPNLDVSSGVEHTRGEKSPKLIKEFMQAVRAYDAAGGKDDRETLV